MAVTSNNWVETVVLVIAVIIGGSLLVWALTMAINNFLPEPFRGKATAVMYIIIAVLLAILVFHWAGLF
jgi:hypothetical protein